MVGVLQGFTLALFLFNFIIVLDYFLRNCLSEENGLTINPRQSRRVPEVKVTYLDFAVALALLSDSIQQAQQLVRDLEHAAKLTRLSMNATKTEHMVLNII